MRRVITRLIQTAKKIISEEDDAQSQSDVADRVGFEQSRALKYSSSARLKFISFELKILFKLGSRAHELVRDLFELGSTKT